MYIETFNLCEILKKHVSYKSINLATSN